MLSVLLQTKPAFLELNFLLWTVWNKLSNNVSQTEAAFRLFWTVARCIVLISSCRKWSFSNLPFQSTICSKLMREGPIHAVFIYEVQDSLSCRYGDALTRVSSASVLLVFSVLFPTVSLGSSYSCVVTGIKSLKISCMHCCWVKWITLYDDNNWHRNHHI